MLDFNKANVEPFPVFIMPEEYKARLEKAVRESLLRKIENSSMERNPTSIMANLAFFYCHDGTEMQSPPRFLALLAYKYFPKYATKLEEALNIVPLAKDEAANVLPDELVEEPSRHKKILEMLDYIDSTFSSPGQFGWLKIFFAKTDKGKWALDVGKSSDQKPVARLLRKMSQMSSKEIWEEVLKNSTAYCLSNIGMCSPTALKDLLNALVKKLGERVDSDPNNWLMPYISDKFLSTDTRTLSEKLLIPVQAGYFTFASSSRQLASISCRICGMQIPEAEDKSILMGQHTHKFHNQSSKQKGVEGPKACLRCAIFTYLMVKLLGSEAVGQPQVPKTYNLIFHYGKHTDDKISALADQIDKVWDLVSKHRQGSFKISEIREEITKLNAKIEKARSKKERTELETEVAQKQAALEQAQTVVAQVEDDIFATCPWMRDGGESPAPPENPALDVLSNLSLSKSKVERHVLGLGMGGYRMILFVLPQIRKPKDAKEHDYSQSRFSNSWLTISAFLSFLNHLCGCNGPFYYQSLPTLTPEAFQPGTFYIRNRAIRAEEVQRRYAAVYNLAWQLVPQRGSKGFVKKVILAEKLLADPLGTFSAVMRDSTIFGQKKGGYKWLKTEYRQDWASWDFTEYVRFIQQLAEL